MEISQLRSELDLLRKSYENDKAEIHRRYAYANNPYLVGDVITDHFHSIKIESWNVYVSNDIPCLVYKGVELKSDKKTPTKKQKNITMYQMNINK